jgi:hypothetical protein
VASKATDDDGVTPEMAGQGVLVRAANGDVIRYDASGLVMRLSDKVIADIADRLDQVKIGASGETPGLGETNAEEALEEFDVWDVRRAGDWLHFSARLPGRQGVRRFRRHVEGGDIIADAPGPFYGLLGIGGARATQAYEGPSDFPQHILAPADDIGAVGHAGIDYAAETDRLEHLRELTHEALVAETFLSWQMEKYAPLPLFLTRVETDGSATATELSEGRAVDNLLTAAGNLQRAAGLMGKTPRILAVTLSFSLEDVSSTATEYRDGMLDLMRKVEDGFAGLGIDRPVFVTRFESGTAELTQASVIEGQWELGWNAGDHRLLFSAPSYMFAHDDQDRPTPDALREMAEMTAAALAEPDTWRCPTFHLAEVSDARERRVIRVVAQSMSDLVLDLKDPMGAGAQAGFALHGAANGARIVSVEMDPADPGTLLLTLDQPLEGDNPMLSHAWGAVPRPSAYAANTGAVRDDWSLQSATGRTLHRWALPCLIPVRAGGGQDA